MAPADGSGSPPTDRVSGPGAKELDARERQRMLIAGGWLHGDPRELEARAREQRKARHRERKRTSGRVDPYLALFVALLCLPLAALAWVSLSEDSITPNDEFFTLSIAKTPHIDAADWYLSVGGLVANPLNLTYANLTALNGTWAVVSLKCVSGPSGTANWSGLLLSELLDLARPNATAREVVFQAADGYSSSLTLAEARADNVILAYQMNGETLPADHGYPLRLVVPGKYGYKWVKWITHIELVDSDYKGYWESRGWDDTAEVASFDRWAPHAFLLAGAFLLSGLALVSGLKQSHFPTLSERLPDRFTERVHRTLGLAFTALFLLTSAWWVRNTLDFRGSLFFTFHGRLSLLGLVWFMLGLGARALPESRKGLRRRLHRGFNQLGFMFLAVILLTGLGLVS